LLSGGQVQGSETELFLSAVAASLHRQNFNYCTKLQLLRVNSTQFLSLSSYWYNYDRLSLSCNTPLVLQARSQAIPVMLSYVKLSLNSVNYEQIYAINSKSFYNNSTGSDCPEYVYCCRCTYKVPYFNILYNVIYQ